MTNPGNALGTNGAYGGRTSVNAFNDVLSGFSVQQSGILSGWEASIDTNTYNMVLGGNGVTRDVAIAMGPNGNMMSLNNISGQPISVALPAPPATGTRYDMVVGYVTNPPQGTDKDQDNPQCCGLVVVGVNNDAGVEYNDQIVREAITADGAAGTTAYTVMLGIIQRKAGETIPSRSLTFSGRNLNVQKNFPITANNIDWSTMPIIYANRNTNTSIATNFDNPTILNETTAEVAGTYLVIGRVTVRQQASGTVYYQTDILCSQGEFLTYGYGYNSTTINEQLETITNVALVKVPAGATIQHAMAQNAGTPARVDWRRSLIAIKVAD